MKAILRTIAKIVKKERGFTLVEMVTVVAIMGVMAAVAVPMVNSQLGKSREQSYAQDFQLIQTSIDSFFTAADNVRYLGQRQFPILATASTGTATVFTASNTSTDVFPVPANPVRGTKGGNPRWRDDASSDGRKLDGGLPLAHDATGSEDNLNGESNSVGNTGVGWFEDKVTFQGKEYAVDSRGYFIDFTKLVAAGLLQKVPQSASPDNGGGSTSGSYSWYIKVDGSVESLLYFSPSNGTKFDGSADTDLDLRGFVSGIYP